MAKLLNTNMSYWMHDSKYMIICNKHWNTSNQQPKQTRIGKTIVKQQINRDRAQAPQKPRTMDFMKVPNHLPLSIALSPVCQCRFGCSTVKGGVKKWGLSDAEIP